MDGGVQVVLRADAAVGDWSLRVWDWGTGGDFDSGCLRNDLQAVSAVALTRLGEKCVLGGYDWCGIHSCLCWVYIQACVEWYLSPDKIHVP